MGKKRKESAQDRCTSVGIDVSKDWFDVSQQSAGNAVQVGRFENTARDHQRLVKWLRKRSTGTLRIALEATGTYGLDLAMVLHQAGMEVMVVNPKAARHFANALMQRTSTDLSAAESLREFAARMPFTCWQPPALEVRQLRALARRMATLTEERTAERNRLHALVASKEQPAVVRRDLELSVRQLTRRIAGILKEARTLVRAHAQLRRCYDQLRSTKGIGPSSAVRLLGELLTLPAAMTAKQWVAHAGLDPRLQLSGSSVRRVVRISKQGNAHLRAALYMPALVAKRWQPNVRAFSEKLEARNKRPLQIIVAVMRKLLHAIHGMFASNTDFDGQKFYRTIDLAA